MTTIYHNPRCSKSRQTLNLLEENGIDPDIILYLENPPDVATLQSVLRKLGMGARDLLRKGEDEYRSLELDDDSLSELQLLNAMCAHPRLIERPIVIHGKRAVVARPPEKVLEIL